MSMTNKSDNRIAAIIEDIYQIDPELVEFEADLSRLLTKLEANRPQVTVNQEFVRELRRSLLSYKPAPTITKTQAIHPFSWWFIRLIPVGISMFLLVVLVPDLLTTSSQNYNPDATEFELFEISPQPEGGVDTEMRMDAMMLENDAESEASDTSMLMMESGAPALEVPPPQAGNTITIASIVMPDSGWVAVYRDDGGELGELLGSSFLAIGEHQEKILMLTKELSYPDLVTIVVYSGQNSNQFEPTYETIQIDPQYGSPMMVTVPVISQFELDLME
jgi:hypothetical protein